MQPAGSAMHPQQQQHISRQTSDPRRMSRDYSHSEAIPSQSYQTSGAAYYPTPDHPSQSYPQSSPYGAGPPTGVPTGASSRGKRPNGATIDGSGGNPNSRPVSRRADAVGAETTAMEGANGERRLASSSGRPSSSRDGSGYAAVN